MKVALVLAVIIGCAWSQTNTPVGYASQNGGTTGGAGGSTVTVTNQAQLVAAVAGNNPAIIKIDRHIQLTDWVRPGSNKSILGANRNAGVSGSGFYVKGVNNVIIRGLQIYKAERPSGADGVAIDNARNVWIDHNDFYSDLDHGKDYYDSLLDITHAADFVTVSWNRFHHHFKVSLVGHSDNNSGEDRGKLRVTYQGNWFYNIGSRLPSLRFGTGHIFNNLFETADSSGINSRMGAQVLVENNVFKNIKAAIVTNLDSSEQGYANERNNLFTNSPINITRTGTYTSPPYTYPLQSVHSTEELVKANAGNTVFFP